MIQIDTSNAGQTIEMSVGEVAEIRLAENTTTGYSWKLSRDGGPNCRVTEQFAESSTASPPRPGQGGSHVWRISGVRPGLCEIAMDYARPWEPNAPAQSFAVTLRIKD